MLPDTVSWKADNYNHLHEAPTLFYAVAIVLAIIGQGDGLNTILAWAYVGLRIAHSIVQATINRVIIRFALYALSSLVLMALILHAGIAVFSGRRIRRRIIPPPALQVRQPHGRARRGSCRWPSSAAMQPIPAAVTACR